MSVLHEKALSGGTMLEVELHGDLRYRLSWGDLVTYEDGFKTVRGKKTAYALRSVEQLRYDFEQDVTAAGGRVG